jgi:valyl-tRNA synthetase
MAFPDQYDPKVEEKKWLEYWQKHAIYAFKNQAPVFSIDTPPPTVSGKMHLGHAFSYTQGDFIARYKRMAGFNVFYPFGTDDNGLPTEKLVEKQKNVFSPNMDRKEFRELCLKTVKELLPEFSQAWKDIGMSADFDGAYSTIDEQSQKMSQLSLLDLYKKGYVYRSDNPVAWCVACQTAIAQAEFDNVELDSSFHEIAFSSGAHRLVIATTRPELLPACVALCYNPNDKRYTHLHGKKATVPLFHYDVPIIADEAVALDKGTGLMMVCTFGDKEDIEKWRKHNLPLRIVFTKDGRLNELAGEFKGLKIKEARKQIVAALDSHTLLVSKKPIKHAVNVHERCGTEIEFLKTTQWFINVLEHKEKLLAAGKEIAWHPEHMHTRYQHWVENLQWDWAISRQRHYGVPFPFWYSKRKGEEGKVLLADEKQLPVDPLTDLPHGYTREEVEPERDVMDTWTTSSVSPELAMGWKTELQQENMPMSLRLQAHDIIRTWAFYTIVKHVYTFDTVPWKEIVISGHVLDPKGQKMSKSKGNVVDPIEVMNTYSTDALRYWSASGKLGDDHPWQEKDITTAKRTINKLFNAGKFTISNIADYDQQEVELAVLDKWLLTKLNDCIQQCTEHFEKYEYSKAKTAVDDFFWNHYCDMYLELVKDRIYNTAARGQEGKTSGQYALYHTMLAVTKLFAPFMPYITEEIYQSYFKQHEGAESVHISSWPVVRAEWTDPAAVHAGNLIVTVLSGVRKFRSEKQLGMKKPMSKLIIQCSEKDREAIEFALADLQAAANVGEIGWRESEGLTWEIEE